MWLRCGIVAVPGGRPKAAGAGSYWLPAPAFRAQSTSIPHYQPGFVVQTLRCPHHVLVGALVPLFELLPSMSSMKRFAK